MNQAGIFEFMAKETLAVLGSISPEGVPQSALVGIAVTADLEIIFDTVKSSRKYRNLAANPKASFVVGCSSEKTVQFEGLAAELAGVELERYQRIYFAKWPDGPSRLSWPGICYFVVRPKWIRYSDFDRRPPEIVERKY